MLLTNHKNALFSLSSSSSDSWALNFVKGVQVLIDRRHLRADVTLFPVPESMPEREEKERLNLRTAIESPLVLLSPELRGMFIHGSAFVVPGKGAVMAIGASGMGKSTNAQWALDRGWIVLADERVVVQEKDGIFYVPPSPIVNTIRTKKLDPGTLYPLTAIGFLCHDTEPRLVPLDAHEAIQKIMRQTVQFREDREANEIMLDMAFRMAQQASCFTYRFPYSPDSLDLWEQAPISSRV